MATENPRKQFDTSRISIRPGVGILSVLRHLNYRPWFALAEFVDNSLQSFLVHEHVLRRLHGDDFRLKVEIEVDRSDEFRLIIRDNAAGISSADYARAFRAAELPADRSGLSEFGMGMKSAACWFAPRWRVRTSALGEPIERTISFDIASIVQDDIEELEVIETSAPLDAHYTEITLIEPYDKLQGKTGTKIKGHLASIYRIFLREEIMELWFSRDASRDRLQYTNPNILTAPYYKTPSVEPVRWYRDFSFDFGMGMKASGFAALREVASTSTAGFALFRRNRLIEGSLDEPYRPDLIFGSGNSYRKQRLIGEIHLHGFEVSHTKDGFKWEDHEQPFLELLREELENDQMPFLSQAEGFRARVASREFKSEAEKATVNVAEVLEKEGSRVLEEQAVSTPFLEELPDSISGDISTISRFIEVGHRGVIWRIGIELTLDPSVEDWISISDSAQTEPRHITVRMSLAHPFMQRFCRADSLEIEGFARIAAALGLSEITARDSGVPQYGTIRRNVNQLLREALSKP